MSSAELNHLKVFVAVAQAHSFRSAATTMNMSPSSVSQAIGALEASTGIALFQRTSRSMVITEAGQKLLMDIMPLLGGLDDALLSASSMSTETKGTLKLNVPRSAAFLLLEPIMASFLAAHPKIDMEIASQDALIDIVRDGFDAGIRFPQSLANDMVAIPLGPAQQFNVVASPELLASSRIPKAPQDLLGLPCIRQRFPSGKIYCWEFSKNGQAFEIAPPGRLTVDDQTLALRAAVDGVGWAYIYEAMARPFIDSGKLVKALADWCPIEPSFQLYYPSRKQASPALRAFIAWVKTSQPYKAA